MPLLASCPLGPYPLTGRSRLVGSLGGAVDCTPSSSSLLSVVGRLSVVVCLPSVRLCHVGGRQSAKL